jgi:hypothetical protein
MATAQGILIPLLLFISSGLVTFAVFCIVRPLYKEIYSPRMLWRHGKPFTEGLVFWIFHVYNAPEPLLLSSCGLDSLMLLRFLKMGYQLFFVLSIIGMGILAPANFLSNPANFSHKSWLQCERAFLLSISVDNVPENSKMLLIHLAFTWLNTFISIWFISSFFVSYMNIKHKYESLIMRRTHLQNVESRSIIVFGIPENLRNEVELAKYFSSLGIGSVENVVLCRNWSKIRTAVADRAFNLLKLEKAYMDCLEKEKRWVHNRSIPVYNRGDFLHVFDSNESIFDRDPLIDVLLEILERLDSIDVSKRPTHKLGLWGLFGQSVDSALYYAKKFQEADALVQQLRHDPGKSTSKPVCIVTFDTPLSAVF